MKTIKIALAALGLSLGLTGQVGAQGKASTLCWAVWDLANALAELPKDFTAKSGIDMKFKFVPWPNFADRMLNELNSKSKLCDLIEPMANRIGVPQAGRLLPVGTPREIYETPASTYVATRLGDLVPRAAFPELAVLPGTVSLGGRTEYPDDPRQWRRFGSHPPDQASGRPEPFAYRNGQAQPGHAGRPASAGRRRHRGGHRTRPPALLRRGRQPHSRVRRSL
jgi:hypothetical protein